MIHVRYLCGSGCHCCFYLCFLFAEYIILLVFVFLSLKVEACQSGGRLHRPTGKLEVPGRSGLGLLESLREGEDPWVTAGSIGREKLDECNCSRQVKLIPLFSFFRFSQSPEWDRGWVRKKEPRFITHFSARTGSRTPNRKSDPLKRLD